MSLVNKAFQIGSFTVTVAEVTASPAVADFTILDPSSVLSESGLIRSILSAAIGDYRLANTLDTSRHCDAGDCGCAVGPDGASWYSEPKKARYVFPETSHTIVTTNLTVTAPFLSV